MYNKHKTFEECLEMDIESIFSRDNYDEVVSRAYAYNHSMYKIFKVNIYHYTNYINKSPLASWYFKYFDIGGPLKPYISMNKFDILHHVDRLKPYFKKWAEAIITEWFLTYVYNYGYSHELTHIAEFLNRTSLPFYITKRVNEVQDTTDIERAFAVIFGVLYDTLARDDMNAFIDIIVEVDGCLNYLGEQKALS